MDLIGYVQKNDMVKILLILVGVYIFMRFYYKENLDNTTPATPVKVAAVAPVQMTLAQGTSSETTHAPVQGQQQQQQQIDSIVAGQTQLTTADLLPNYDQANAFTEENPVSKLLQEQNFLQAGYHMGINTVVQSNKIAYLDLRSAPPIPKQEVGPFLNSSYEQPAGSGRRFMELGS
jgi:hypothetical protein